MANAATRAQCPHRTMGSQTLTDVRSMVGDTAYTPLKSSLLTKGRSLVIAPCGGFSVDPPASRPYASSSLALPPGARLDLGQREHQSDHIKNLLACWNSTREHKARRKIISANLDIEPGFQAV